MHQKGGDRYPYIQERLDNGLPINPLDEEPEVTELATRYINLFQEINSWRKTGNMGPSRIGLDDIQHYCHITGIVVNYLGLKIIRALDDCYLEQYLKSQEK